MHKTICLTVALALLAACAHAPPPTPAPTPSAGLDSAVGRVASRATAAHDSAAARNPAEIIATKGDSSTVSLSEVNKRAAEVFGDSGNTRMDAEKSARDSGPSWDIEVRSYETTQRVERYLRIFSGDAKERFTAQLEQGTRYEPMIRAKMREGGIPEDMYYLALIESGFDPNAYSRAAAVGMWQFMASTGRDMGLRVDWWVDERRDPVKSTAAAVRFIRGLKEQLGSLYLAAAAYNGGPGRIARGLTRFADDLDGASGDDRFFVLADKDFLPRETREYVPQLIATALIAKEPQRYGMNIRTLPPLEYDSVHVGPATPLAAIAKATGTTTDQIRELNPHILRGMTPPRDSLKVRVPVGSSAQFADRFEALTKEERAGVRTVTSKKGEYAETIADKYGLTTRQLLQFNPKIERVKKTGRLVAGQSVLVPARAVAAAATNAPDPSIERYSRGTRTHVVRRGETLGGIAKKYHTTVKALMALNGLKRSIIFPGQSLVVSGRARSGRKPRVAQAAASRNRH